MINNNEEYNKNFGMVYPGEVYVCRTINGRTMDVPSDKRPGERCGFVPCDGYMMAINEPHGWRLDHTIFFDYAFNAYIKGRKSIEELTDMVAAECGIRPDDVSDWANDLRTVIHEYIVHFDMYLEDEEFMDDSKDLGDPAKLNKFLTGIIFDGICLHVDIYDIAEDIRAFKPYTCAV